MRVIELLCVGDPPDVIAKRFTGTPDEIARKVSAELEEEPYCDYADILLMVVRTTPANGYSEEDVVYASEVISGLKYCMGRSTRPPLMLNENTYRWLCLRLSAFRWRIAHKRIVDFINLVKNAPTTDTQSAS